jgi:hypothetical protein
MKATMTGLWAAAELMVVMRVHRYLALEVVALDGQCSQWAPVLALRRDYVQSHDLQFASASSATDTK